jgi:CheY-like chemotaxis protein
MHELRILLVDDDFTINLDIRESLEECGFVVESVYCAGAAFEALDYGRSPLALITDIDLGPGPDGFDVARRARANYPDLPVVFISGTRAACFASQGVAGSEFLDKPVRPQQVIEALRRVMALAAARCAGPAVLPQPAPRRSPIGHGSRPQGHRLAAAGRARQPRGPAGGGLASQKARMPARGLKSTRVSLSNTITARFASS